MKVVVLCQEEPVFLGPFLRDVIQMRPDRVAAVLVAGRRSAGERHGSIRERWGAVRTFWLLFEPRGFLGALGRRIRLALLGVRDPHSVEGLARSLGIPVHRVGGRRAEHVLTAVQRLDPDVVLNQSEILLTREVLDVPRAGFLNRHASLLPAHRGRMGAFWAHSDEEPRYGVTIHKVDEGIDTGDVLVRWEAVDVDPRWPFPRVLRHLNARAPELFWEAIDRLERGMPATPQVSDAVGPAARFPTLEDARRYRDRLARRRAR